MTKSQIEVGTKYFHPQFPGTVYLGTGQRIVKDTGDIVFKEKNLIIIKTDDFNTDMLGVAVAHPKQYPAFWTKFEKISA